MSLLGYLRLMPVDLYVPVYTEYSLDWNVGIEMATSHLNYFGDNLWELPGMSTYQTDRYVWRQYDTTSIQTEVCNRFEPNGVAFFCAVNYNTGSKNLIYPLFTNSYPDGIVYGPGLAYDDTIRYLRIRRFNSNFPYFVVEFSSGPNSSWTMPLYGNGTLNNTYLEGISSIFTIYPSPPPINFYHCSEVGVPFEGSIQLARGESSSPMLFTVVDSNGHESLYGGEIVYTGEGLGTSYTISDNIITVAEHTTRPSALITAKPADFDGLFSFVPLTITNPEGPYDEGGNSGPGGGGGSGSPGGGPSGPGTDTLVPNGSNNPNVASGGTFTMYAANMGTLQGLGAWLYSSNFFDAVGRDIMSSLWNSPIEGIISVTAFPFGVPASSNVPEQIKFGCLDVPISLPVLQNSSMQINWGSVTIEPTWNNFLDYAPHTKIELYLPFSTGFVNIDPADVIDGTVSIVTNVDLIKGTCVHIVSGKYGVIGTYGGICGVQIPVSAIDTSGKALNLLVSGVTTAVTAGAGAVGHDMQALGAISKTPDVGPSLPPMPGAPQLALPGSAPNTTAFANKVINVGKQFSAIASRTAHVAGKTAVAAFRTPASVQRSGSFATNAGGLGPTTPFIIYSCPALNIPRDYGHFYGYPLNATMRVGDLKGYSEITGVHLNNIPALLPELDEISSLLEGGVIL